MATFSRTRRHDQSLPAREENFYLERGFTRAPVIVQWMATLRCPLSCAHCLAAGDGHADMPLERALDLVDECAAMGVDEFLVTGGEPLAREDLGAVVRRLGERGLSWSINTSAMPAGETRRAIEENPPGFAAVSLDGPEEVHDEFRGRPGAWRESLESIRFFKSLPGTRVCAGTTLTSRNFPHIEETFHLAVASGADGWGLHLLVPEGRAAARRDLFLSRGQIKRLLRFAATKRNYFPVGMADEIGYLGAWEPLVRDVPLRCGAGKAQCVVLPDGSVVPCTTLDRSTAAGNVNDAPLAEIWENGDWPMRQWTPSGKCGRCEYAAACGGGCWLQRCKGQQCFKDAWHTPGMLKTAAGVAVCLGMMAVGGNAAGEEDGQKKPEPVKTPPSIAPENPPVTLKEHQATKAAQADDLIENYIAQWYLGDRLGRHTGNFPTVVGKDPAWAFFDEFKTGKRPEKIAERAGRVKEALKTEQRSLAFAALMWRYTSEPLLDGPPAAERTAEDRRLLRESLAAMDKAATAWRAEIFTKRLDPYLLLGPQRLNAGFMRSKAGPKPGESERFSLSRGLNEKRWGKYAFAGTPMEEGWASSEIPRLAKDFLEKAPPYAAHLRLPFILSDKGKLEIVNAAGTKTIEEKGDVGIFDVIIVPKQDAPVVMRIDCGEQFTLNAPKHQRTILEVRLPPDAELTWMDVVRLADEQNHEALNTAAQTFVACMCIRSNVPRTEIILRDRCSYLLGGGLQPRRRMTRTRWNTGGTELLLRPPKPRKCGSRSSGCFKKYRLALAALLHLRRLAVNDLHRRPVRLDRYPRRFDNQLVDVAVRRRSDDALLVDILQERLPLLHGLGFGQAGGLAFHHGH
jgi:AdoMet-dependent heme synthase